MDGIVILPSISFINIYIGIGYSAGQLPRAIFIIGVFLLDVSNFANCTMIKCD